jgi:transmembrane sensor
MEITEFDKKRLADFYSEGNSEDEAGWVETIFCDQNRKEEIRKVLSGQFKAVMSEDPSDNRNLDNVLYKIHYDLNMRKSEKKGIRSAGFVYRTLRIAAMIVLPLALFWGIKGYFTEGSQQLSWVEIKAPAWTRAKFTLPDGTTGWLNSNSSVRYSQSFVRDRKVTLNGEAFFDVFRDKKRPFIVITDDVMLNVTGTRFNIAAYDNEPEVEVVLEEGSLIFNDKKMIKTYSMKPNDLVIYDKEMGEYKTEIVQPQKYLSWTEGKLVFRNDPLDVICRRLGRWYNVDVAVNVGSVENLRLRATFIDENLEEVLDLLKRSLPIDYKIQNGNLNADNTFSKKRVTILPKNQTILVKNQKKMPMK